MVNKLLKKTLIALGLATLVGGVVYGPTIKDELRLRIGAKGYVGHKYGFELS